MSVPEEAVRPPDSPSRVIEAGSTLPPEQHLYRDDEGELEVLLDVYGPDDIEVRVRTAAPELGPRIWTKPLYKVK